MHSQHKHPTYSSASLIVKIQRSKNRGVEIKVTNMGKARASTRIYSNDSIELRFLLNHFGFLTTLKKQL